MLDGDVLLARQSEERVDPVDAEVAQGATRLPRDRRAWSGSRHGSRSGSAGNADVVVSFARDSGSTVEPGWVNMEVAETPPSPRQFWGEQMSRSFRSLYAAVALAAGLGQASASAQDIAATIANFNDNFLTLLRQSMTTAAGEREGVSLRFEDAQLDVGRQLDQVQNFIASGVDGIIIAPVDGGSTEAMSAAAEQAGIPVVFTNNLPVNLDRLPPNQVFVGSNETESGRMQGEEICRQLKDAGIKSAKAVILLGDLSNPATRMRTDSVKAAFASEGCPPVEIQEEQTAMWQRNQATDLMTNWLSAGIQPDVVVANNDEMAIGAVLAMKSVGTDMKKVIVAGIDATPDALAAMGTGDMDVTVLQSASGQGKAIVETMLALIAGKDVPREVYVPYELVTPANYKDFMSK